MDTLPPHHRRLTRALVLSCALSSGLAACSHAPPRPPTPASATGEVERPTQQKATPRTPTAPAVTNAPTAPAMPPMSAMSMPSAASENVTAAPATDVPGVLASRIQAVLSEPRFRGAQWGIQVVSLRDGRTVYAHDADQRFIPASNAKLYSVALAMSTLGTRYRFSTSLYATAHPSRGVLHGNLVLYGRGDPSLGSGSDTETPIEWADRMADAAAARGIGRIDGDLIADASHYTGPPVGAGWEANDLQNGFAPEASALTVQGNVFSVRVGTRGHQCCDVDTSPSAAGVQVSNLTRTVPSGTRARLGLYRETGSRQLAVYGGLHDGAAPRHFNMAAPEPPLMAGELLRDALVRRGIRLDGQVRVRRWPQRDTLVGTRGQMHIADHRSASLAELAEHTLKHSDNLYAQLLLLGVGARAQAAGRCDDRTIAPDWTVDWGLCAMRAFLDGIGIARGGALFEEGSGLSRKDLVTPRATTTLLAWVARQPFASAFRQALPIAGVDGTLRHRLRGTAAQTRMQAKTGTLRYAYALSGYVSDADGEPLAFSIMLNGYERPSNAMGHPTVRSPTHDIDAIAAAIAAYHRAPVAGPSSSTVGTAHAPRNADRRRP